MTNQNEEQKQEEEFTGNYLLMHYSDRSGNTTHLPWTSNNELNHSQTKFQHKISCPRILRCMHKLKLDAPLLLAANENILDIALYEQVEKCLSVLIKITSLISGFTYTASNNSGTNFEMDNQDLGPHTRLSIYGFFTVLSFTASIMTTLFSFLLYGTLTMLGKKNIRYFFAKCWLFVYVVIGFFLLSVIFMIISLAISIGGNFEVWVSYSTLAIAFCSTTLGLWLLYFSIHTCYRQVSKQSKESKILPLQQPEETQKRNIASFCQSGSDAEDNNQSPLSISLVLE